MAFFRIIPLLSAFAAVVTGVGCAGYPPVVEKELSISEHMAMQTRIKEWIRKDCGSCHTSDLPTANAKALRVFDFKYTDWMSRMNERQLEKTFTDRLGSTVAKENRGIVVAALGAELYRRRRRSPM